MRPRYFHINNVEDRADVIASLDYLNENFEQFYYIANTMDLAVWCLNTVDVNYNRGPGT